MALNAWPSASRSSNRARAPTPNAISKAAGSRWTGRWSRPGFRVGASQTVSLLPGARLETLRPVTILVHKPVGVYANDEPGSARDLIVPANRMEGDRSPQRYLKRLLAGLRLVTPLERAASGLVVYTQEYPVARKLQEEARLVEQEYIAEVSGSLDAEGLAWLRRGLPYDGLPASPMQVSWQNETRLRFALKTPAPGFIEYACDAAGLELRALRRIRIGRLPLAGLPAGQWRARWTTSASEADAIRRAADILKEHARPMPHDSIPPARRGFLKQAGMLGLAALTLGGCATRRTVAPRSSGGAQAAMPAQGAPVPPLRPGGRVAIVAPASAAPNAADDAADWLLSRGYQPRIMPAARSRLDTPFDYLAGTDAERAADLHAAFTSADIDAVWCLQGGFGSWRLLDLLDYELLRRHAKPFIGYSDITALHLAIQRHAGFVTFHGPMLAQDLLNGREEPTESALYAMVGGRMGQGAWIGAPDYALPTTLMPGTATGRLAGGNLALICAMQGSRHEIDTRDAILFIEDVNEAVPRVDRMLSQLAAAGKFESIKGVLAGSFTRSGARDDAQFQYAFHPAARALRPAGHSRAGRLAQWPRRSEPDAAAGRAGHVGRDAAGPAAGAGGHALSHGRLCPCTIISLIFEP